MKAGHVYAAEFGGKGIKLGRSRNPKLRLSGFKQQMATYGDVKVKRTYVSPLCVNYAALERELHATFATKRIAGELFGITFEEACEAIDRLEVVLPAEADEPEVTGSGVPSSATASPRRLTWDDLTAEEKRFLYFVKSLEISTEEVIARLCGVPVARITDPVW